MNLRLPFQRERDGVSAVESAKSEARSVMYAGKSRCRGPIDPGRQRCGILQLVVKRGHGGARWRGSIAVPHINVEPLIQARLLLAPKRYERTQPAAL